MVKNPPVNAGDTDLIPESGRFLAKGNGTHSRILTWEVPWTEEPGSLQFMGSQKNQTQLNNKFSKEYFHCHLEMKEHALFVFMCSWPNTVPKT